MYLTTLRALVMAAVALPVMVSASPIIYASGQFLIENGPGTADDVRENRMYSIDVATGVGTPLSSWTTSTPGGLGGIVGGDLLGFNSGQLGQVAPTVSNSFTTHGGVAGVSSSAFDVLADGRAFVIASDQLHQVDRVTGIASAIGVAGQIGDAFDTAFGLTPGTSNPFLISLGSVGDTIYGASLEGGRQNLVAINPNTGAANVIGAADALDSNDSERYSGYSALTGVDENGDGEFDALFGAVNFWDHDNNPITSDLRLGGVARYDLGMGTWSLVGTNPGVIFFGFGSSPATVPEPSTPMILMVGGLLALGARRRRTC